MALHISEPGQRKRRREDDENVKNHISKRTKVASLLVTKVFFSGTFTFWEED